MKVDIQQGHHGRVERGQRQDEKPKCDQYGDRQRHRVRERGERVLHRQAGEGESSGAGRSGFARSRRPLCIEDNACNHRRDQQQQERPERVIPLGEEGAQENDKQQSRKGEDEQHRPAESRTGTGGRSRVPFRGMRAERPDRAREARQQRGAQAPVNLLSGDAAIRIALGGSGCASSVRVARKSSPSRRIRSRARPRLP